MLVYKESIYDFFNKDIARTIVKHIRKIADEEDIVLKYFSDPLVLNIKRSKYMSKCVIFINHYDITNYKRVQESKIYEFFIINGVIKKCNLLDVIKDVCLEYEYKKLTSDVSKN